jgi:DNA repair exonuclease SbcCD ATPase subunit
MTISRLFTITTGLLLLASLTVAQQSDYEIKERFRQMYETLKRDIDSARTKDQMALLSSRIDGLEHEFAEHSKLIAGAFHPKTLESMINELRDQYAIAQAKNTTIQEQSDRIATLENQIAILNTQIEGLNAEREMLLAKLKSAQTSLAEQREIVKRLRENLNAKDRLVSALVDSIFLPFGKNIAQLSEVQKEALAQRLEKASVISRIADIAQDNIKFLGSTKLEAKDYGVLVSQYEQFNNRWAGLKEKLIATVRTNTPATTAKGAGGNKAVAQVNEAEQVDAALLEWRSKLDASFWAGLMNEFTSRNVLVQPFNDGKSFAASIRSYVESAKNNSDDNTKVFVDEIWIQRIDKDWRSALESESMLGKLEYASLDRLVSQLHKDRFNWQIVFWIANVIAVILVGWWFLTRKPKTAQQEPATAKPNA